MSLKLAASYWNKINSIILSLHQQTTANHLKLNLDKTELLFMPGKDGPQTDLLVTIEDIDVSPVPTARNLLLTLQL